MQIRTYISSENQATIDTIIRFFEMKLHTIYQIGYCLVVSLEPTAESEETFLKEGVHLFTNFHLFTHTSAESKIKLGELNLVTTHTHPNIIEMLQEFQNSF